MAKAEVSLISYTGHGNPDPMYAARLLTYTKNTRLEQGAGSRAKIAAMTDEELAKELNYIAGTIRSSWEFVDYTFEVRNVTRAFTHQFVRTRTGSYAQQAQRVVNMQDFDVLIPQTVYDAGQQNRWEHLMREISLCYAECQRAGVPIQDCRGVLPTNVMTNIIAKFNLRTMADLCGKRDNPRAQGEYIDVIRLMKKHILAVHPWAEPFLSPDRTATPALDELLAGLLGTDSPIDRPQLNAAMKEIDKLKATWG